MGTSTSPQSRNDAWAYLERITRPALSVAPPGYLDEIKANLAADGIPAAVRRRDTPWLVDSLIGAAQFQ